MTQKRTLLALMWGMLVALIVVVPRPLIGLAQDSGGDLRLAYVSNRTGNQDIYIMSTEGENVLRANLTNHPAQDWNPLWSPDGAQIVFNSDRDGRDTLYIMGADGSNARPLFLGETFNDYDGAWSPDGTQIAFISDRSGDGRDIYIVNPDGTNLRRFTDTRTIKGEPVWSPDGLEILFWDQPNGENGVIDLFRHEVNGTRISRVTNRAGTANGSPVWLGDRIYFDTNRSGTAWEVYSVSPDGSLPERATPEDAAGNNGRPTLSPDGSKLVYVTDQFDSDEIMLIDFNGFGGPRRLTDNRYSDHSPAWQPAVPAQQSVTVIPTPVLDPIDAQVADDDATPVLAIGLSASGFESVPITKNQLLNDYGINTWHLAGWKGAGVRVGVIDVDFGGLSDFRDRTGAVRIPENDLLLDYDNSNNDHGTKVLEIIRAIAPEAELFACKYAGKLDELRLCVEWMANSDVRIINHSVGFPILPLDGSNPWAALADETYERNILWVNAAGNFRQGFYEGNYVDRDNDGMHDFVFGNLEQPLAIVVDENIPYTGKILLSWDNSTNPSLNFDLKVIAAVQDGTDDVLGSSTRAQDQDFSLDPVEVVQLAGVNESFEIQVINNGEPLQELIRFTIFVEYLGFDSADDVGSPVVAPADAYRSLTIGSVNGRRELGVYSSAGVENENYDKPDLSAPGEIYMDDGSTFIGTSAAAPVVAGVAALLIEENPTLVNVERLYDVLKEKRVAKADSRVFGTGIIQLGAPPSERRGGVIVEIPPKTVFPQPEEDGFIDQGRVCPGAAQSRFEIGLEGYVNYNLGLAIRETVSGRELDRLDLGMRFEVLDGPECAELMNWWQVRLETGAVGWVGEGSNYYLIAPSNLISAQLPTRYDEPCPNALETQLQAGSRGITTVNGMFFYRATGRRNELSPVNSGTVIQVLGGPVCEGKAENVLRWYVRIVEGSDKGIEGWLSEGDTDYRNIEPLVGEQ